MNVFNFRTTRLILITSSIISANIACNPSKEKNKTEQHSTQINNLIAKVAWLLGDWKESSSEGYSLEIWKQENDSVMTAVSYSVQQKDTLSTETIRLEQRGTELFYIPTVTKQNDGKPVEFHNTLLTDSSFVFENPAHDFPQMISYRRINPDSIVAEISGNMKGKRQSVSFPMQG